MAIASRRSGVDWPVLLTGLENYFVIARPHGPHSENWPSGIYSIAASERAEGCRRDIAGLISVFLDTTLGIVPPVYFDETGRGHFNAAPFSQPAWWQSALRRIAKLQSLKSGWDGNVAEPPSSQSETSASQVLRYLSQAGLGLPRITPSVEGGIGIAYEVGDKYAFIECYNDGEVVAAISSNRTGEHAWECGPNGQSFQSMASRIAHFLRQ